MKNLVASKYFVTGCRQGRGSYEIRWSFMEVNLDILIKMQYTTTLKTALLRSCNTFALDHSKYLATNLRQFIQVFVNIFTRLLTRYPELDL